MRVFTPTYKSTLKLTALTKEEAEKQQSAAVIIQKHFKGYKARITFDFIRKVLNKSPHKDMAAKLRECLTSGENALEKALSQIIFLDKASIQEFMKILPFGSKRSIGELPWQKTIPEFNQAKLKKVVADLKERQYDALGQEESKRLKEIKKTYTLIVGGKKININYIGEGLLGWAYKINAGDKNYVIKIFRPVPLKDHFRHGAYVEPNIACFIRGRQARKGFAKFYFADLGKDSFMITKFVDKAKPPKNGLKQVNARFITYKDKPQKKILCVDGLLYLDSFAANTIGKDGKRKIIDYGAIMPRSAVYEEIGNMAIYI